MGDRATVTELLHAVRAGESSAWGELMARLETELRGLAGARMRRERADHTLAPTALVHETFIRLADGADVDWQDRAHFLGMASRVMRQVLVDHGRKRQASHRVSGGKRLTLVPDVAEADGAGEVDVIDLHERLEVLAELHERRARVVELRFFGGLTVEETAHVLEVSPRTVEADWYFCRAWLRRELDGGLEADE